MELGAEGLAFTLTFTPPDCEGWMWCNAIVDTPSFRGELDFQMLRSDLDLSRTQLSAAVVEASWPCDARLASTDTGIDVSFRVERTGQIAGAYQFGGCGAHRTMLSGAFVMDQTYLCPLLAEVDRILAEHA